VGFVALRSLLGAEKVAGVSVSPERRGQGCCRCRRRVWGLRRVVGFVCVYGVWWDVGRVATLPLKIQIGSAVAAAAVVAAGNAGSEGGHGDSVCCLQNVLCDVHVGGPAEAAACSTADDACL